MRRTPQAAHGLDEDRAANAVVHGFGHDPLAHVGKGTHKTHGLAQSIRSLSLAGRADIDIELGEIGVFAELGALFGSDDANAAIGELHPPASQRHRVNAADPLRAQESLFVDIADDEADLVHVRGQHHLLALASSLFQGDQVAQCIDANLVGERLYFSADDLADLFLAARRAIGLGQFFNQLFHRCSPHESRFAKLFPCPGQGFQSRLHQRHVWSKSFRLAMLTGEWM